MANDLSARVKRSLTAKYAGIQGTYFGAMVSVTAFASVFLLHRGFTNSQIGTVIALGNIGSAALQLAVGHLADRSRAFSIRSMISAFALALIALSLVLTTVPMGMAATAAIYASILVVTYATSPLINSLNFLFRNRGITANYGLARAAGSIVYALLSAAMGKAVARYSPSAIPWLNVLMFAGMLFFVAGYRLSGEALEALPPCAGADFARAGARESGMADFARRNGRFLVFLAGVSLVYLSSASNQTYLLQILMSKGGGSASLGVAAAIGAACEVPMMVGFAKLNRSVKSGTLIQVSMLFFTLKSLGLLLAPNVTGVYFAMGLNMFSFAMFVPASVYYVSEIMGEGDKVKGQAYLASAIALSGICANFAGGRILDAWGAGALLKCVIVLSALGNAIVFPTVRAMRGKGNAA